jgi:glutaredoxin
MVQKSGQRGVPVLDINGQIIVGFDNTGIDYSLEAPISWSLLSFVINDQKIFTQYL